MVPVKRCWSSSICLIASLMSVVPVWVPFELILRVAMSDTYSRVKTNRMILRTRLWKIVRSFLLRTLTRFEDVERTRCPSDSLEELSDLALISGFPAMNEESAPTCSVCHPKKKKRSHRTIRVVSVVGYIQRRDDDEKIIHDVLEEVISFVNADNVCPCSPSYASARTPAAYLCGWNKWESE